MVLVVAWRGSVWHMYTCAPLVCQTDSTRLVRVDEQVLWWDVLAWTQIQAAEV